MPNQFTSNTFSSTYNDDYLDSDNYYRILFNSGRALQARELTQLQTIIQEELGRLGRHLFKEGSIVNPGGLTLNNNYEFIKLNTTANALPSDPQGLVGVELSSDLGISFIVLEVVEASGADPATIFVRYTDTSAGTAGGDPVRVEAGATISGGINPDIDEDEDDRSYRLSVQTTNTVNNPAVGKGSKISFHAGDFFAEKHFVFAPSQSVIVSKYNNKPTANIGFKVLRDVITASDNVKLYDNTGATPNLASPGADRFRIRLVIANESDVAEDENFIQICRIADGNLFSQIGLQNYNRLNDILATRTREESGNYIVKPFELSIETNDSDTSKLDFNVSQGIAYVDGYRAAPPYQTILTIDKPRTTIARNNNVVSANYGNYVVGDGADQRGIPNIVNFQQVDLMADSDYSGSNIGSARIRHVSKEGTDYRLYLFDIQMNPGQNFRDVTSIGNFTNDYFNIKKENGKAVLKDAAQNSLLFPLPISRPQSISDIVLTVQRRFVTSTNASGEATINLTSTDEVFVDEALWIAGEDSTAIDNATFNIDPSNNKTIDITNATPNAGIYEVLGFVQKNDGVVRNKSLTETTEVVTWDSAGVQFVNLGQADIYDFISIKKTDSDGEDLSGIFRTDNGQRDNYYALGKLHKLGDDSVPPDIFVRYKYFDHGTNGDFFSVNSYAGQVAYEDIPSFTQSNGTTINLRDVIDFRSRQNNLGQFSSNLVNELPRSTDVITFDANYYVGKSLKLSVNRDGIVNIVEGAPGVDPQLPKSPENSLDLYNVNLNPYIVDDNDLSTKRFQYKRFTMADIGRLEKRVSNLEDITSLTLLELETSAFEVLDAQGLTRTKSGFFVDNFKDQTKSYTLADDYRASIDPKTKTMRPPFSSLNVAMSYDSDRDGNQNVVLKGDNIYLAYSEEAYISNNYMTGTENVNPFAVIVKNGILTLSPESDEWFDVEFVEPKVVDGGFALGNVNGQLWDDWNWNWSGAQADDFNVGGQLGGTLTGGTQSGGSSSSTSTQRIGNTIRTTTTTTTSQFRVDNFVRIEGVRDVPTWIDEEGVEVSRVLIPKMRSRKIAFRAEGLRPNTQHFAFLGKTPMADWVREATYVNSSTLDSDFSSGYEFATEHPDGKSTLIADANGLIEGSLFIPNTSAINFDAGEIPFSLLDISVNNPPDCTSIASKPYTAAGYLIHKQQTVLNTKTVDLSVQSQRVNLAANVSQTSIETQVRENDRPFDPLAQTFYVEETEGVFVTNVKLRFATKDANNAPVIVQLRPTTNGAPSSSAFVPGSIVVKSPAQVATSADGSAITTFTFEEPVYLTGNEEFAIVIITDSKEYNVYVAEAGEYLLGSTEARLTRQATLGSLFKSQNSTIWEPDQTKDLTFELTKAVFAGEGNIIFENKDTPRITLKDKLKTTNGSNLVYVSYPNHGFVTSDSIYIRDAVAVGGISAANIVGERQIDQVDGFGFKFVAGANATSTATGGGETLLERQSRMDTFYLNVENILPSQTTLSFEGRFVTGESFAGNETPYQVDAEYISIPNKQNVYFSEPRILASRHNEIDQVQNQERSVKVKATLKTTSVNVSPVVDMQRTSCTAIANRIDQQGNSPSNNNGGKTDYLIDYVAETSASGGTALAKHITNPVTLAETATGIKVMFSANRPNTASIELYYRTNGGGQDGLLDTNWILATIEEAMPTDENKYVYRDYRYLIGGLDGTLDEFDQFQLKVVMKSTNTCKIPTFKDLRAIALTA